MTDGSTAGGRAAANKRALTAAVNAGDAGLVRSLLAEGADPNAAGYNGRTLLMRAASTGRLEVVRALLDAGAEVDAQKENGATALIMAVFFGHAEVARLLLARGADPSATTPQGVPVGEWAEAAGFDEVAALLRSAAALRARRSGAAAESEGREEGRPSDAALLFPSSGTFRPVVPLSNLDSETAASVEAGPAQAAGGGAPVEGGPHKVSARDAQDEEADEATLVPPRVRTPPPPRPRVSNGAPLLGTLQSGPFIVLALALLLAAGLILDARWRDSRRQAENQHTQSAADSSQVTESETQAATAGPAEPVTATLRPAQPAPQAPAPDAGAADESAAVLRPPADAPAGATPRDARAGKAERASAVGAAPSKVKPVTVDRPPSRRAATAETRAKVPAAPARRAQAAAPASGLSRRQARAPRPARQAPRQASTSASAARTLPVSSPPPSAKSGKVIQWP